MHKLAVGLLFIYCAYAGDTLLVGVNPFEPMVIYNSITQELSGFDIDLWRAVAAKIGLNYKYAIIPEFDDLLTRIKDKSVDVGLAGISITSAREAFTDFSCKYFKSGLAIVVRTDKEASFYTMVRFYIGIVLGIFPFFILYVVFSLCCAVFIWMIEKGNPQFGPKAWPGIFYGWYWVNVVLATVGFGDKAPLTKKGQVFCVALMMIGIFFIMPIITGNITAKITAQKIAGFIETKYDLKEKIVAVEKGSTSVRAAEHMGARTKETKSISESYKLLQEKCVDAIVCDVPAAKYLCKNNQGVMVAPETFEEQDYGIALQLKSPYRKEINKALLEIKEEGLYDVIYQKYFGYED